MSENQPGNPTEHATARVYRSPRIFNFLLAGAIVGAVVALILTFAFPANEEFSAPQIFGFLFLIAGTVFGAIGALVALVLDRRFRKRARSVQLERDTDISADTDTEAKTDEA